MVAKVYPSQEVREFNGKSLTRLESRILLMAQATGTSIGSFGSFETDMVIKKVEIPPLFKAIDEQAFLYCPSLESVVFPQVLSVANKCTDTTPYAFNIDSGTFDTCEALKSVVLPKGLKTLRSSTFRDSPSLKDVTLPEILLEIEQRAFDGCDALTHITIPNSLVEISADAFEGCGKGEFTISVTSNQTKELIEKRVLSKHPEYTLIDLNENRINSLISASENQRVELPSPISINDPSELLKHISSLIDAESYIMLLKRHTPEPYTLRKEREDSVSPDNYIPTIMPALIDQMDWTPNLPVCEPSIEGHLSNVTPIGKPPAMGKSNIFNRKKSQQSTKQRCKHISRKRRNRKNNERRQKRISKMPKSNTRKILSIAKSFSK